MTAHNCPSCGAPRGIRSVDDMLRPCTDPWHDVCPTCGGAKKLLSGEVFMCTDEWHYRWGDRLPALSREPKERT